MQIRLLGQEIRSDLNKDRQRWMETVGEDLEKLLTGDLPRLFPHEGSLVDKYPRRLRNPPVVARRLFLRLQYDAPQLSKYLFCLRLSLASVMMKREARPAPEVV